MSKVSLLKHNIQYVWMVWQCLRGLFCQFQNNQNNILFKILNEGMKGTFFLLN